LHADADAEHRTSAGEASADHLATAHPLEPGHDRRERADSRDEQPVRLDGLVDVGAESHVRADPLESADGRADVAESIVEDDDAGLAGHPLRLPAPGGTARPR